jgi:hypothetical protein
MVDYAIAQGIFAVVLANGFVELEFAMDSGKR